jgi:hypothetical protein
LVINKGAQVFEITLHSLELSSRALFQVKLAVLPFFFGINSGWCKDVLYLNEHEKDGRLEKMQGKM